MPHYSFGFEKQHKASHRNTSDPGPVYDVPRSATRCGNIVRATYSFGTGPQRGQPLRSQRVPGPGHYPIPNALGPQLMSVNKSGQVVSFGVPSALGGVGRPIATTEGQHTRHGQDKSPCSPRSSTALEAHLLAQGCPLGPRGEPSPQAKMAEPPLPQPLTSLPWDRFQALAGSSKILARLLARQAEPVGPAHPAGDEVSEGKALHDEGSGWRRHAGAGALCRLRTCGSAATVLSVLAKFHRV